jgi:hypothetical protein
MSKYWIRSNKEIKPRDVIFAFKKPEGELNDGNRNAETHEKNSRRMAELARTYHDNLQSQGREGRDIELRNRETENILEKIETEPNPPDKQKISSLITEEEVKLALKLSDNDKAAGLDGATYEMWKSLAQERNSSETEEEAFDIIHLMTAAFNDIEQYGTTDESSFADGWMCPIYKKKERDEIENYRPITLLNTDYKLMTKVLAMRLAEAAPTLLHKSQAGFVPGRQISEQTQLFKMVLSYAEAAEENGMIVALDQAKAYDKIEHDYLWKTLKAFKIPDNFIRTVQSLYSNASTRVMINGTLSSKFRVTRGVRQGDPLSCLLFDLGIEPLSLMIRKSNLKGLTVPRTQERLVANLFADDTTTFLTEDDSLADLTKILDQWCLAAGAQFNTSKTQILPMGSKTFRAKFIQNRRAKDEHEKIPESIHIAKDGESIRILGAWLGNDTIDTMPWSPIIEKIETALARWENTKPTIEGRKLLVQMIAGGFTQYLTQVQQMPKKIEKQLQKIIRTFIWGDKKSPVKENMLLAPKDMGGRGLLDIHARNEAIQLMWLKSYLNLDPSRALWADYSTLLSPW